MGPRQAVGSLLFLFCGFLRSGEVTVPSAKDYDPEYHQSEGDVALDNLLSPTVARLQIKGSKSDPGANISR